MKCRYCKKEAEKINTRETRAGSGTTVEKEYVCITHSRLGLGRFEKPEEAGLIEIGVGSGNFRAKKTV